MAVVTTVAVRDGEAGTTVAVPGAARTEESMAVKPLDTIIAARPRNATRVPRMHCVRKVRCIRSTMREERIDMQSSEGTRRDGPTAQPGAGPAIRQSHRLPWCYLPRCGGGTDVLHRYLSRGYHLLTHLSTNINSDLDRSFRVVSGSVSMRAPDGAFLLDVQTMAKQRGKPRCPDIGKRNGLVAAPHPCTQSLEGDVASEDRQDA